jgi:glycosyltransferase involved in cell wall biosynthesis
MDAPEKPLVSIIMNCLNCEKYLREAIESVYAQTYPRWEIIFWDNASTDRSAAIARDYDDRLRYFRGDHTVLIGAARNEALKQVRGEFIAFLDCDDLWLPTKLEKQVPLFADPEVGLVFSDSIYFTDAGETWVLYQNRGYATGSCFSRLLADYFLDLGTVMLRARVLSGEAEWFAPTFNLIEEAEFFTRIAYRWKLAMVPEPLAKWRIHGTNLTWQNDFLFSQERTAMLGKFEAAIPDFRTRYAAEIEAVDQEIALTQAKHRWKSGDGRGARQALRPWVWRDKKALLFYGLTFLPPSLGLRLVAKVKKGIMPF